MERYQVRLHQKPLSDFLDEVAASLWNEIRPLARSRVVDTFEAVSQAVWYYLGKHLHRFESCGTVPCCHDDTVFQPLARASEVLSPDPNMDEDVELLQLFVPTDLKGFLATLVTNVWRSVACEQDVLPLTPTQDARLAEAARRALAPHVYFNTECGRRSACVPANERPLLETRD
jgi:hypothetical protein